MTPATRQQKDPRLQELEQTISEGITELDKMCMLPVDEFDAAIEMAKQMGHAADFVAFLRERRSDLLKHN